MEVTIACWTFSDGKICNLCK